MFCKIRKTGQPTILSSNEPSNQGLFTRGSWPSLGWGGVVLQQEICDIFNLFCMM
jgi:hypothetical protein